jgi:hypothetical protein
MRRKAFADAVRDKISGPGLAAVSGKRAFGDRSPDRGGGTNGFSGRPGGGKLSRPRYTSRPAGGRRKGAVIMCRHRRFGFGLTLGCLSSALLSAALPIPAAWADDDAGMPDAGGGTVLRTEFPLKFPRNRDPVLGGSRDKAWFRVWLPPDVKTVRGGICNPFSKDEPPAAHWREACRRWGFAYVQCDFDAVKKDDHPLLMRALAELAGKGGRPELEHLPMCFIGMSRGGGISMQLGELVPDRTIAVAPVCLEVGPTTEAARAIPVLTIFGEKDGKQGPILLEKLPARRKDGARWAVAIQWGRGHEFALANNLAMVFFEDAIRLRLPAEPPPAGQPVPLREIPLGEGRLADHSAWGKGRPTVAAPADFKGDPASVCWLPTARTAAVWRAFVAPSKQVRIAEPPGMGDKQPFVLHPAEKPVKVRLDLDGSLKPSVVELWDADALVAKKTEGPWEFDAALKPGLHALIACVHEADGTVRLSRPHTILVADPPQPPAGK